MLAASSRRRIETESLSGRAYDAIKSRIVALELPPASVIDESQLGDELEIGLTPIRQALRRLALENLVVILPRRGTIVADLNASDLDKIYEMRVELESLCVRLASRRKTVEQIASIQQVLTESRKATAQRPTKAMLELDYQWHRLIWQSAHNEFLEATLDGLFSHALRFWNYALQRPPQRLGNVFEEHSAVLDAIIQGDEARAADAMRNHVSRFQQEMANLF